MPKLGSLLSRTLAVVILGAALYGSYRLIVAPIWNMYRSMDARIAELQFSLGRSRALAQQSSELKERLAEWKRSARAAAAFLESPSSARAAAQVQDRIRTLVGAAGGTLTTTQILPAETVEGNPDARRVPLRVQFTVSSDGLFSVLYDLEAGEPYLFVEALSIHEERATVGSASQQILLLEVDMQVFGYVREAKT